MNILVCDDDPIINTIVNEHVRDLGHPCRTATSGDEAWALLEGGEVFEVIISDWRMPGLSGVDLCQRVRLGEMSERRPYTYFILLTNLDRTQNLAQAARHGADAYLSKPFTRDDLARELEKAERVTSLHRRLAQQRAQLEKLRG